MTNQFFDATKKVLSTAAQAVLTALTQQEYGLNPADIPNEAGRMACIAAAALRAAAYIVAPAIPVCDHCCDRQSQNIRHKLLAIADELEQQ